MERQVVLGDSIFRENKLTMKDAFVNWKEPEEHRSKMKSYD